MKTITTNKTAAQIRNAIKLEVEGLPGGLQLETLTDIYRCIVLDSLKCAMRADTPEGRKMKQQIVPAVSGIATIEGVGDAAELIFTLTDKYTNINGNYEICPTLDTVLPEFRAAFIADFTATIQA